MDHNKVKVKKYQKTFYFNLTLLSFMNENTAKNAANEEFNSSYLIITNTENVTNDNKFYQLI